MTGSSAPGTEDACSESLLQSLPLSDLWPLRLSPCWVWLHYSISLTLTSPAAAGGSLRWDLINEVQQQQISLMEQPLPLPGHTLTTALHTNRQAGVGLPPSPPRAVVASGSAPCVPWARPGRTHSPTHHVNHGPVQARGCLLYPYLQDNS